MFISVVIPAYNEEKQIGNALARIKDYLTEKGKPFEIIVVDDGSSDKTVEITRKVLADKNFILLRNKENRGKGYSVRRGILISQGKYVLFSDADLSTPIEELEKLIPILENGYDVAIGSRALAESNILVHQKWHREALGRLFNIFVRNFIMNGIRDTQCGFKCFKRKAAQDIFSRQTYRTLGI